MCEYRLCFVGIGSIAKRHIRNVIKYSVKNRIQVRIDVLRSGKGTELEKEIEALIDNVYYDINEVKDSHYDAVFITCYTSEHAAMLKKLSSTTNAFFIEKPVFHTSKVELSEINYDRNKIYYIACPLRYSRTIRFLKENIDFSKVINIRVTSASFLPDWRKGDYRNSYSAKKEYGGGVSIDLIHEWDYITYLIGFPISTTKVMKKVSNLEINCEDIAIYIGNYENKIVELHLDYFSRIPFREIILVMNDELVKADLLTGKIEYLVNKKIIDLKEERNDIYIEEIKNFFDIMEGKKENFNDIKRAMKTLKLAEGIV